MNFFSVDTLITQALKRRYIVVMVALLLLGGGYIAFKTLSLEAYPDFTDPLVRVITILPGKGAEEMERLVTVPLEKELNGIPGETNLRSLSIFGLSVVYVKFQDGTKSIQNRQQVLERISQADLPDVAKPQLDPDASPIGEIYRYTLESNYYDPMTLKALEDWQLEKAFRQIPGVIDVTSFGGPSKTYKVQVDAGRLRAYNLSITQVYDAISRSNSTTGGNYIENNGQAYIVRGLGLLKDSTDLGEVVISASTNGTPVRVRDVATISTGPGVRLGQVGKNRQDDVIQGIVLMRRGEDPSQVVERLYEKLPQIQASLPNGVKLVPLYDRTELVRRTIETISHNVAEGVILVVAVLLLFLFEVRSALIAATVIPLALLFAFVLLNLFHIPANLLSLGAVDFGIIVDGTVVMVENIYRRLAEEGHDLAPVDRVQLTLEAAKDVGKPILFATGIIVTAFLPIFAFDGVAGKLFHPLAFTMTFALLGAVLVGLTVIPVLCSFILTRKPLIERESPVIHWAEKVYRPLLEAILRQPQWLLGASTVAFIACALLFGRVGSEFLPNLDEGNIWLRVTVLPTSVSLEKSVQVARAIRSRLILYPEVKNVVSQAGSPDDGTDANTPSNIEFLVDLKKAGEWRPQWGENKEKLVAAMDRDLQDIPGILTTFSQYIQDNVDEAIAGAKGEVAVKIYGPELSVLQDLGDRVAAVMTNIPGMVDVADDKMLGQPQYQIQIDRAEADRYGVNTDTLESVIETAVGGKVATQLVEGERKFNVLVRFDGSYRSSPAALGDILVPTPAGPPVPLSLLAKIQTAVGATTILRSDNSRLVTIKANVRERDLGSAVADAQQKVNSAVKLPNGYSMVWGGQYENQQRANSRLALVLPVTVLVIFLLLYTNFGKVGDALLVLSAVPLAAIGGILALFITHTYFSVSAGVGFIAAAGVSVQNGVIILAYIKQLARDGLPLGKAVVEGALTRLRPVLMAGTVAILGLIPAALSNGIGSQSQKPFAIVIIGGVFTATLLTIFVVPALYSLIARRTEQVEPREAILAPR
ncbi:efflux RND transporter permease subunit [Anthocerotibacter panamensis]|uniref:efflux RND transporter permease subunit n=1 Tax=Anthocerotibacter panamensis TaxID=2857077 RepID=UPI001C4019E5|nr:CusA/CzcA family heavy metal efflux RND transporter [Anthocerotibacter panamensis]